MTCKPSCSHIVNDWFIVVHNLDLILWEENEVTVEPLKKTEQRLFCNTGSDEINMKDSHRTCKRQQHLSYSNTTGILKDKQTERTFTAHQHAALTITDFSKCCFNRFWKGDSESIGWQTCQQSCVVVLMLRCVEMNTVRLDGSAEKQEPLWLFFLLSYWNSVSDNRPKWISSNVCTHKLSATVSYKFAHRRWHI